MTNTAADTIKVTMVFQCSIPARDVGTSCDAVNLACAELYSQLQNVDSNDGLGQVFKSIHFGENK